ncbi:MAG: zinc metalloprotease [Leptospiraceae bacterium]|nr:MAG: zinc metalloprotease [Leptospiraceae bacterium]
MLVLFIGGILLLGITIVIHELGHLLLGKLVGIKPEIFSIGYGKGIWKRKIGDTIVQITPFPFGGYVKFYGDDYLKDYSKEPEEGAFFSKPPLIRIIPVLGGPFFNLLLGFIIFLFLGFYPKENPPIIQLWEELENSPAKISGLKNGDIVLSINGEKISNFRELQERILLSGGSPLHFQIKRGDKILNLTVIPEVDPAGRASIGIRVPGERYIQVDFPFMEVIKYKFNRIFQSNLEPPYNFPAMKYLEDGDIILELEGKEIGSTLELQRFLGSLDKELVQLKIRRQKYPYLLPWITEDIFIEIPFRKEYRIYLKNIKDLKYNQTLDEIQFMSFVPEHLRAINFINIDSKPLSSFEDFYQKGQILKNKPVLITFGNKQYLAQIDSEKIGLMGFRPNNIIEPVVIKQSTSLGNAFIFALKNTYNNIAIYPKFFAKLFSGRISFIENTMGPVGMFAVAGIVMQTDIYDYLQLMASISIALMIINLIPFPIVDGGHIVLFLIEAIRHKRLPITLIENLHKTAFIILMSLGLWIMFRDILFVLGL